MIKCRNLWVGPISGNSLEEQLGLPEGTFETALKNTDYTPFDENEGSGYQDLAAQFNVPIKPETMNMLVY